jgi:hypothetical protein
MWHELKPADFQRARHVLNLRRADTLRRHAAELLELQARHAEDIKALDAKYVEIDALETMVTEFVRGIKPPGDLIFRAYAASSAAAGSSAEPD